jgi:hypothetical protein
MPVGAKLAPTRVLKNCPQLCISFNKKMGWHIFGTTFSQTRPVTLLLDDWKDEEKERERGRHCKVKGAE